LWTRVRAATHRFAAAAACDGVPAVDEARLHATGTSRRTTAPAPGCGCAAWRFQVAAGAFAGEDVT
jgi:hypothetical protein